MRPDKQSCCGIFGLFLGKAVMLFHFAKKFLTLTVIHHNIVIGKFAPGAFNAAFDLFEKTVCLFLVHIYLLSFYEV
jgi:hypothetical protein